MGQVCGGISEWGQKFGTCLGTHRVSCPHEVSGETFGVDGIQLIISLLVIMFSIPVVALVSPCCGPSIPSYHGSSCWVS